MDISEPSDRLSVTLTLLLTAVAFKFVVSQSLPTISYLTLLVSSRIVLYYVKVVGDGGGLLPLRFFGRCVDCFSKYQNTSFSIASKILTHFHLITHLFWSCYIFLEFVVSYWPDLARIKKNLQSHVISWLG